MSKIRAALILSVLLCGLPSKSLFSVNDVAFGEKAPDGNGQLETAPKLFKGGVDDQGRDYFLNGQVANNGKLILTASNGFFGNGTCRAGGLSSRPKVGDQTLIKPNFAYLDQWKKTTGTIRWHLWLPKAGTVYFDVNMRVSPRQAGSELTVSLAGKSRSVTTISSSNDTPQPWGLRFDVTEPGEHIVSLSAKKIVDSKSGVGELHTVDV